MQAIEEAFKKFTDREDVAIILINQYVCHRRKHYVPRATSSKLLNSNMQIDQCNFRNADCRQN